MLLLGVLLALSLATIAAVLISCELQARELRTAMAPRGGLPVDERAQFDALVASLLADDPEFGRIDR